MSHNGIRLRCPQCTFTTIQTQENADAGGLPPHVNRKLYDAFFCPNCPGDMPLEPVSSVETSTRPTALPNPATMSDFQKLETIASVQREADTAKADYDTKAAAAKSAKQQWEAKRDTLDAIIKRLTREVEYVEPGPIIKAIEEAEMAAANTPELANPGGPIPDDIQAAAHEAIEGLRLRLAAFGFIVHPPDIMSWELDDYNEVVAYVTALESLASGGDSTTVGPRPLVLAEQPPEFVLAMRDALGQAGFVLSLPTICQWTRIERDEVVAWLEATLAEHPSVPPLPACLPKPQQEPQRVLPRTRKGRRAKPAPAATEPTQDDFDEPVDPTQEPATH